ncbi:MAG: leucine-rich repeat protein [Clostridia bacterium]|nr:leucine-rich repeat protein [Clostridia bacterium]
MKKVLVLVLALMLMMILISFASCEEDEESSEQASSNEQESSSSAEENSSSSVDEEASSTDDSAEPHICEFGEWQTVTEATCIEKGLKRKTCLCGKHVEEEIPATGIHTYELGKCKHCKIEQASQGLEFHLDWATDTYILAGLGTCTDTSLVIPSTYNDKPVSSIGDIAMDCRSITSITIPSSITSMKYGAFEDCPSIERVNYLGTIEQWCNISFDNSSSNPLSNGAKLYLNGELVTDLVIPTTITEIKDNAFRGCISIMSVTISNSVTSIGDYAFYKCYKLVEVYNPSSLNIAVGSNDNGYIGCYAKIVHASLDESSILETVNNHMFMTWEDKCYLIGYVGAETELILPDNYKNNDYETYQYAFFKCYDIKKVTIPNGVTSIGDYAFYDCVSITNLTIPNSVISIGNHAFMYCSSLTSVEIPNGVCSIGDYAFYSCGSIRSITIPNSVKTIGSSAFRDLKIENATIPSNAISYIPKYNLKTVVIIGGTLPSIGYQAFLNCESLESVTIGDGISVIRKQAFYYLPSLTSVTITNDKIEIEEMAFSGCPIENVTIPTSAISHIPKGSLKTAIINGGTTISDFSFRNCTALTSVTISDSVTLIGSEAFEGCASLTSITIPNSVTTINDAAFKGCTSLKSVTLPYSVTTIRPYAFENCTSLASVTFENPNGWYCNVVTSVFSSILSDTSTAAKYLTSTYCDDIWTRS